MRIAVALLGFILFASSALAQDQISASQRAPAPSGIPLGFSRESYTTQQRWENRFLVLPNPKMCRKYLRQLTREPHVAGTPGDRRVTQYIYDEFQRAGLIEIARRSLTIINETELRRVADWR